MEVVDPLGFVFVASHVTLIAPLQIVAADAAAVAIAVLLVVLSV